MCVPSLSEGIKAAVPLKTDVIKRAQITTEDTRPHPLTVRILGAPQAKAGFFGPVGKAAVACLAGFYCPAGSAYGVTCPANTASPAGAADVLACLVIRMCWHGMHVFTWVCVRVRVSVHLRTCGCVHAVCVGSRAQECARLLAYFFPSAAKMHLYEPISSEHCALAHMLPNIVFQIIPRMLFQLHYCSRISRPNTSSSLSPPPKKKPSSKSSSSSSL